MAEDQEFKIIRIISYNGSDDEEIPESETYRESEGLFTIRGNIPIVDEDEIEPSGEPQFEFMDPDLNPESQDEKTCSSESKSKRQKRGPYKRRNIKKVYTCRECGLELLKLIDFRDHMKKHRLNRELYACEQCPKAFKLKAELKFHLAEHKTMGVEKLCCLECEFKSLSSVVLEKHIKNHHTKHVFIGDSIKSIVQEKKVKPRKPEAPLKSIFECNLCLLCFDLKSEVYAHEKFHLPDRVRWKVSVKLTH